MLRLSDAGRALFVSSAVAQLNRPFWGGYAITKAGLEMLVKTYAAELTGTNQGQPTVVLDSWDAGTRTLTLRSGLIEPFSMFKCTVNRGIEIPGTLAKGSSMSVIYTGPGTGIPGGPAPNGNTCSQVSIN